MKISPRYSPTQQTLVGQLAFPGETGGGEVFILTSMEEKKTQQEEEQRWEYLKQQISNLARFAEPPMDIGIINLLIFILWGFNAASIGWLGSTLFTEGRTGAMYWIWLISGFVLGGVAALVSFLNRMYNHMSRVKLSGKDYHHVESSGDKAVSIFYSLVTVLVEIIACAMFTYAIVNISDSKVDKTVASSRLEEINKVTAYKDSLFAEQRKHYIWLDADGDTTNDRWARMRLDEVERDRKAERAIEDSIRESLSPIVADTLIQLASASTGTVLIKDFSKDKMPKNSRYKLSLAILAGLLGVIIVGGLSFLAKIKGRWKAFQNINKVYQDVEQGGREIEPHSANKYGRFIKRFNKVYGEKESDSQGSGGGVGTTFNWDSETIQERVGYIKANYHHYGGEQTQKQIAATLEVGESYISQLIKAAIEAKKLPPIKK